MARARLLKPGFFTNEALGEVEPLGRLLFAGLWSLADREGRLADRPKRIKAEVLPYDRDVDVDRLLDELAARCFIARYEVEGERFIQVTAFTKHQRPHIRELPSTIPGMAEAMPGHHLGDARTSPEHNLGDAEVMPGLGQGEAWVTPVHDLDEAEAMPGHNLGDASLGSNDPVPDSNAGRIAQVTPGHDLGCAQAPPRTPLTLNQKQKPFPEAEAEAVAVAEAGTPAQGADERLPLLVRHWERSTGTTVTPALADWLDSELGEGTPPDWLRDAISETGANGIKAWKYTQRIIERWRVQGREPAEGGRDGRGGSRQRDKGRAYEAPCRVTGQYHDWPNLPGWCERCTEQEPITLESLRRKGLVIE